MNLDTPQENFPAVFWCMRSFMGRQDGKQVGKQAKSVREKE